MPFIGTIANFAGVLICGALGAFLKKGLPKRICDAIVSAMAICVIYVGFDGALEAPPAVSEDSFLSAGITKLLIMIISMGLGALIGELIDIDRLITKFGAFIERKISRFSKYNGDISEGEGGFAKGFVSCTLLFSVGAMALNGGIQDGLGNPEILLAKTVVDAINAFVMATTLGIGCAFSGFSLLIYQGAIAVISYFVASAIPAAFISYMSMTGSLIIVLIGTNMLGVTRIKTANLIPAMFIPLVLAPLFNLIF